MAIFLPPKRSLTISKPLNKSLHKIRRYTACAYVPIILSLGLWIRFSGQPVDDSSTKFHMTLGIATSAVILVTFIVAPAGLHNPSTPQHPVAI
jgi:hypothetical protein